MTTMSEQLAVLAAINPADLATTAASTGWVNMKNHNRILALVIGGAITGTLAAKLEQAQDASDTGKKDVTGKAITTIVDTADNKQASINLRADELDVENGFYFVRLTMTPTGGTTNLAAGLILGGSARYAPPANAASHVQSVP